MATPKQYSFSYKELAELMVKDADIKEGHWGIFVKFGLQGANIGASDNELKPAAIVGLLEIGLQNFDTPNSLSVDAAEIQKKKK